MAHLDERLHEAKLVRIEAAELRVRSAEVVRAMRALPALQVREAPQANMEPALAGRVLEEHEPGDGREHRAAGEIEGLCVLLALVQHHVVEGVVLPARTTCPHRALSTKRVAILEKIGLQVVCVRRREHLLQLGDKRLDMSTCCFQQGHNN